MLAAIWLGFHNGLMALSIIIPNYNSAVHLKNLLEILSHQIKTRDVQLIVSDGGSDDEGLKLAIEYGAQIAIGYKGRGAQLARAIKLARYDWLLFLHSDSLLGPDFIKCVFTHIDKGDKSCAAYFKFRFNDNSFAARWVAFMAGLRAKYLAMPYGDQGLLIPRDLYERIGGYKPLPLFEDLDIIERLGAKRLVGLNAVIITDASKYRRDGFIARSLANLKLLRRYKSGEDVSYLAKLYNCES